MYGQKKPSGLDELKVRLKEDRMGGAFLLWGAEEYTKDHYAEKIRKLGKGAPLPDFNYQSFDVETGTPGDLEEATFALPYLWDKRVIELRGLPPQKGKKLSAEAGAEYARVLSELPEYLTVLLVLRAGEKEQGTEGFRTILQAFEKHGLSVEFETERGAQLIKWVARHFASRGVQTDPGLPQALISYCGADMYTLHGEIEKLCAVYEGTPLTQKDVHTYCCANESAVFFDVAACMNRRDMVGAKRLLSLLDMDRKEVSMAIGHLASNYQLMLLAQAGRAQGKTAARIASDHKQPTWKVEKAMGALARMDMASLRYAISAIAAADQALKSGRSDPAAVLELLVYRICNYRGKQI